MSDVLSSVDTTVGSGAYNRRVTFQLPNDTVKDGQGGTVRTWTTVLTTWAHMEAWKGREAWIAGQSYSNMWTRVLLRYRTDINISAMMRMTYGRRTYDIRSVSVPAEAHTTIELLAEELQTYGSLR